MPSGERRPEWTKDPAHLKAVKDTIKVQVHNRTLNEYKASSNLVRDSQLDIESGHRVETRRALSPEYLNIYPQGHEFLHQYFLIEPGARPTMEELKSHSELPASDVNTRLHKGSTQLWGSLMEGRQPTKFESSHIDRSESRYESNGYDLTGQVNVQDINPEFKGNYSSVFKGTMNDKLVAVKIIHGKAKPSTVRRRILRERTVWTLMKHLNILPFYGYTEGPTIGQLKTPFGALISPWFENGDAGKFLEEHGKRLSKDDRIMLWKGVIDGVAYLHQHRPAVVHGDLKPGNVIIDDSGCPRICDFGLAQIFYDETDSGLTTTTEHTGTGRYLAPELLVEEVDTRPTAASDIYAVGCLGLEFVYLKKPYSHRKNNLRGVVYTDIKKGIPPAVNCDTQSSITWSMIKSCWDRRPESRPTAFQLANALSTTTPIRITEIYE
ncbi:hypothetical protein M408DRAFT_330824 [Serendipita vermifera MAFF 305830]|uniref:Protein kinase domain-containing protein n=1 Tax=Serendipita vermifera MAFF 305830 TaxID=933852 RepID=A0A0C3B3H1_SERVB|nr:hypothetical protein M408DRAFT_330824 [Serendipita vermifera MAFF 305830]